MRPRSVYLCLLLILSTSGTVIAQSDVSGRFVVEPLVGRHYAWGSSAFTVDDIVTVFGGRALWRQSYANSMMAELTTGSKSSSFRNESPDGGFYEGNSKWRRTVFLVGVGSTVVDRDANGGLGLHMVFGAGLISDRSEDHTSYRNSASDPTTTFDRNDSRDRACFDLGVQIEVEVLSPRVLLRGAASLLIGFTPETQEGTIWIGGSTWTGGIAAAF